MIEYKMLTKKIVVGKMFVEIQYMPENVEFSRFL